MEKRKKGRQHRSREFSWESFTVQVKDDMAWWRAVLGVEMGGCECIRSKSIWIHYMRLGVVKITSRFRVCTTGKTAGQTTAGTAVFVCAHHHFSACQQPLFQAQYGQFLTFSLISYLADLNLDRLDQATWWFPSVVHLASCNMTPPHLLLRSCKHSSPPSQLQLTRSLQFKLLHTLPCCLKQGARTSLVAVCRDLSLIDNIVHSWQATQKRVTLMYIAMNY